jgi:N-hydroxyarylamine O-acetyltransferase
MANEIQELIAAVVDDHQTSSKSYFTRDRICSMAKPDGRITLSDMRLIITSRGIRQEQVLASEGDWRSALRDHFGVVLNLDS